MTLFRNKYRVESIRKPNWDYATPGLYFVTICTHEMRMYFGMVVNSEMKLSTIGRYAERHWREIPNHFKNVSLDEFVVMPIICTALLSCREPGNRNWAGMTLRRVCFR